MLKVRSPDKVKPYQLLILRQEKADYSFPSDVRWGELTYLFMRPNQRSTKASTTSTHRLLLEEGSPVKQFKVKAELHPGAVVRTPSFQKGPTEAARGLPIPLPPHTHTYSHLGFF